MFRVCSQHNNGLDFIVLVSTCRDRVFSKFLTGPIHVLKHNTEIISRPPGTHSSRIKIFVGAAPPGLDTGGVAGVERSICWDVMWCLHHNCPRPPGQSQPPSFLYWKLWRMKYDCVDSASPTVSSAWAQNSPHSQLQIVDQTVSVSKSTQKIVQKSWRINRALTCLNYRLVPHKN